MLELREAKIHEQAPQRLSQVVVGSMGGSSSDLAGEPPLERRPQLRSWQVSKLCYGGNRIPRSWGCLF